MTIKPLFAGFLAALALIPCSYAADNNTAFKQKGAASYYAERFHGRKTASGQRYDKNALTAAHRTLPMGTRVRVTNLKNGNSVVVEINDRAHLRKGHILDLSIQAAQELRMINSGMAQVEMEILSSQYDT